jgi:hypothetical protein
MEVLINANNELAGLIKTFGRTKAALIPGISREIAWKLRRI